MIDIDTKEKIFNYFKNKNSNYATFQSLKKVVKVNKLENVLWQLVRSGELIFDGKRYSVNHSKSHVGVVSVNKNGARFVKGEDGKRIPITSNCAPYVLPRDTIEYRVVKDEAYVSKLIKRELKKQVFQVKERNGNKYLEYTNGPFYIKVPASELDDYMVGDYLYVDINNNMFNGIIKKIDNINEVNGNGKLDKYQQRDIIIGYNHGFSFDYDDEYLDELKNIKLELTEKELANRKDYRNDLVYTIDCDNTRDMDDALSLKKLDNGNWLLTGHIASISEYVNFLGPIYNKAVSMGNSFYTGRIVIPMFHHIISNDICSLNENADRLTKSLELEINSKGEVVSRNLYYGVINSKKKMKYSEVDKLFTEPNELDPTYWPFAGNLYELKKLSDIMGRYLARNGKIEFANRDLEVVINENGVAKKAVPQDSPISRKIIENCMVYLNWQYGIILSENLMPSAYRNHHGPTELGLQKAMSKLSNLGYNTDIYERTGSISAFIKQYQSSPSDFLVISNILLPCFGRAYFSSENAGHYGLGIDVYSQFSSGIRKSSNLINHYIGDMILTRDFKNKETIKSLLPELCDIATQQEIEADEGEREALQFELIEIASNNIGYDFEGVVTGTMYGNAYTLLSNGVTGVIFNKDNYLVMGDRVYARIESVNLNKKEVNLTCLEIIKTRKGHKKRIKVKK